MCRAALGTAWLTGKNFDGAVIRWAINFEEISFCKPDPLCMRGPARRAVFWAGQSGPAAAHLRRPSPARPWDGCHRGVHLAPSLLLTLVSLPHAPRGFYGRRRLRSAPDGAILSLFRARRRQACLFIQRSRPHWIPAGIARGVYGPIK